MKSSVRASMFRVVLSISVNYTSSRGYIDFPVFGWYQYLSDISGGKGGDMSGERFVTMAISYEDWRDFGCPECCHDRAIGLERNPNYIYQCTSCEIYFAVLPTPLTATPYAVRFSDGRFLRMSVEAHPYKIE
jgi:ribosomal protein L37AE/L43A